MEAALLRRWIARARGRVLAGARGEELTVDGPRPVRRVTRLWLDLEGAPPLALGLDPEGGGLRWDDAEPHAFELAGFGRTRPLDVSRRAAIARCLGRTLTDAEPVRFAHAELPAGLRLEFDGFLALHVLAWGDAVEAWDDEDLAELERQGFALVGLGA